MMSAVWPCVVCYLSCPSHSDSGQGVSYFSLNPHPLLQPFPFQPLNCCNGSSENGAAQITPLGALFFIAVLFLFCFVWEQMLVWLLYAATDPGAKYTYKEQVWGLFG